MPRLDSFLLASFILFFIVGVVIFSGLSEFRRYQQYKDDETLAYPRSRLIRREVVAALALGVIFAVAYKPAGQPPAFDLSWYGACLVGTIVIAVIALRDLRETSVDVVEMRKKLQADTEKQLSGLLKEASENRKREAKGGRPKCDPPSRADDNPIPK